MHIVKGAWAGKIFAVAACNDSGGRKARIRRSKEERKSMVETFIKTYQKSNNGNFPSLNLTHKEVGGSFYLIREIVREIIQENRVLGPVIGPVKLPSEEQNEDSPFLSFPIEPHSSLSSADAIHVIRDVAASHYQSTIEGDVLVSNGQLHTMSDKNQSDNEQVVLVRSDIIGKDRLEEPTIPSHNEIVEDVALRNLCHHHHQGDLKDKNISFSSGNIAESGNGSLCSEQSDDGSSLTVEKVEPSQVIVYIDSPVKERVGEKEDQTEQLKVSKPGVTRMIPDVVIEKFPLRPISMTFEDWDENLSETKGPTLDKNAEVMKKKAPESTSQSLTSSTNEAATATDFKLKDSSAETKSVLISQVLNRPDTQEEEEDSSSHLQKENNPPPLDRINLETWKGISGTSTKHDSNPLLALFNAFITAIVKILS